MARYAMIIDLDLCIGCNACTVACKAEHGTQPGVFWGHVLQKEYGKTPRVTRLFLPVLCNHCEDAPCEEVCPTSCRKFGDWDAPDSEVAQLMKTERTFVLRPEAATGPRVHYMMNKNLDVVRIR